MSKSKRNSSVTFRGSKHLLLFFSEDNHEFYSKRYGQARDGDWIKVTWMCWESMMHTTGCFKFKGSDMHLTFLMWRMLLSLAMFIHFCFKMGSPNVHWVPYNFVLKLGLKYESNSLITFLPSCQGCYSNISPPSIVPWNGVAGMITLTIPTNFNIFA